jgi:transposase InsO family protein
MEYSYIESFNGKFKDECLNENWFLSIKEAKGIIEEWGTEYNASGRSVPWGTVPLLSLIPFLIHKSK